MTHEEALAFCTSRGGTLASIYNQGQNTAVSTALWGASGSQRPTSGYAWIGGAFEASDGTWRWADGGATFPPTDGANSDFHRWSPFPRAPGRDDLTPCAAIQANDLWTDKPCDTTLPFVCQSVSLPPPSPPPPGLPMPSNCTAGTPCRVDDAFAALRSAGSAPAYLHLTGATHLLESSFVLDSRILASEVRIVGLSGAVLSLVGSTDTPHSRALTQASGASAPLLVIDDGAPPIFVEGLILRGQLRVNASSLHVRDCVFDGQLPHEPAAAGAALHVSGGAVEVRGTRFTSLEATDEGGAVAIYGGSLALYDCTLLSNRARRGGAVYAAGGTLLLHSSVLVSNAASEDGGALAVDGTAAVLLANGTHLRGNTASATGGAFAYVSGSLNYALPAPLGTWVASGALCVRDIREECSLIRRDFPTVPDLTVATLTQRAHEDTDYPFACPPGVVGDSLATEAQTRPTCNRPCDAQFYCPAGTVDPHQCPAGEYCERGVSSGQACPRSMTSAPMSASLEECICDSGFYDSATGGASITCGRCSSGFDCHAPGLTTATLPVKPGHFRLSNATIDVRRCPDASEGCDARSSCRSPSSGCAGGNGNASDFCRPGLAGVFCQLCAEPNHYYVAARGGSMARCNTCGDTIGATIGIGLLLLLAVVLVAFGGSLAFQRLPGKSRAQLLRFFETATPRNKLKILVGFYMIATKISTVYEVRMPDEVARFLEGMSVAVTLGLDLGLEATPLACVGLAGYTPEMRFWTHMPLVVVLLIVLATAASLRFFRERDLTPRAVLLAAAPLSLKWLFLIYPIVTRHAFEAFSFHDFEEGSWLRADVRIERGSAANAEATASAILAILAYPVGLLVVFGLLLHCASTAILTGRACELSEAIRFLHGEYKPRFFWWELSEMSRRFLLVGVLVTHNQGSIEQLGYGTLVAFVYLIIQLVAAPYRKQSDNFFAAACSLFLFVMFFASIFYKVAALTQLSEFQDLMSSEQKSDFHPPYVALSLSLFGSSVGALVSLGVLFVVLGGEEAHRAQLEARAAKARRLRYVKDDAEVVALEALAGHFHTFLSHVWGTGQDQMRIVKQRLLEMVPNYSVFLDVDDLREIGDLAGYIERTQCVLIFCSEGYFQSRNCMIELRATVAKGKPIIALVDADAKKGGLTKQQVLEQLLASDANYEKWGFKDDGPRGHALHEALFAAEPIEWNRIGAFQDITMRLIAQRLLPEGHAPSYVQGELISQPVAALPHPRDGRQYHVCMHASNAGAAALLEEVGAALELKIETTTELRRMEECECMLVYLNAATWTSGEASAALAVAIGLAMDLEVRLLLAHEMVGVGGQEARGGCEFASFFSCPDGATPATLLKRGIYDTIAVALKGGAWREASMVMMAQALAEPPRERAVGPSGGGRGRLSSVWAAVAPRLSLSGAGREPPKRWRCPSWMPCPSSRPSAVAILHEHRGDQHAGLGVADDSKTVTAASSGASAASKSAVRRDSAVKQVFSASV